jgi:hypothetical protein
LELGVITGSSPFLLGPTLSTEFGTIQVVSIEPAEEGLGNKHLNGFLAIVLCFIECR